jgi:hypothetical protein
LILLGSTTFSLHHYIWNGSVAHFAPYPMVTGGSFPSYTSTAPYIFMVWYLVKHWDNFSCRKTQRFTPPTKDHPLHPILNMQCRPIQSIYISITYFIRCFLYYFPSWSPKWLLIMFPPAELHFWLILLPTVAIEGYCKFLSFLLIYFTPVLCVLGSERFFFFFAFSSCSEQL